MPESTVQSQNTSHEAANYSGQGDMQPMPDLVDYMKEYARQKPEVCALWCLGVGFVLGWKLKPW